MPDNQTDFELSSRYDPRAVEGRWYELWENRGYFHADPDSGRPPFSQVIPPPNVTGVLHMGHALNNTLQDIIARRRRMQGYEVLWIPGTDHAGIATQNVVERRIEEEGANRHEMGREEFVDRVWRWKEEHGGVIISQLKRLGCSCDWERERFTMDDGCSLAVRTVFKELYDQGLIYRGKYIINWCVRCHTALSDIEVEHEDKTSHLWHIRYPLADGALDVVVATTRPETMLGDTAVAVHPSDERYAALVGKSVMLPLTGRRIPVIVDRFVDPEFGTGAVKVTPAHDPNDYEIGLRHDLERINILNPDGTINENGGRYAGMDRYEARDSVVRDLDSEGLLVKREEHLNAVGHCYRCGTEVEPYLSTQWFVKMAPLAAEGIKAVREGRVKFTPERWDKIYYDWMENIRDWCISRQLWWGHRIPVWYCDECGEQIIEIEAPAACPCGSSNLRQDEDVLDTWFSSALWPFSTMGWPEKTRTLDVFYPTTVLTTAFDIIFFWVARMVMFGLRFMDDVPFREVFVTALVRDYEGKKMSKSSGNVIDPIDVIEVYGTDALRFTLGSIATPGRDINLAEERIEGNRNFVNKIWNAARLVIANLEDYEVDGAAPISTVSTRMKEGDLELADRWILSTLAGVIERVDAGMDANNFSVVGKALHQFFWGEFCDWYLELVKPRLYHGAREQRRVVQEVACRVLECSLRLLHPYMPFVTEELWQKLPGTGESIMIAPWPDAVEFPIDDEAEREMKLLQSVIVGIRAARSEHGIPPSGKVEARIVCGHLWAREVLERQIGYLVSMAGLSGVDFSDAPPAEGFGMRVVIEDVEAYLSWERGVDPKEEIDRLARRLTHVEADLTRTLAKLASEGFVSKAPPAIVAKEREKERELTQRRQKLDEQIRTLGRQAP
ncbi:MAG: valine--tRNA ligase [Candidatus Anoxymicrobium japonicum]|uniref:Valine--tRNA ligase n=1 Tax=Candidatus Anoxymicrobium japonicum TaxID=2013648 RepID=A0A2N3G7I7_9ACTN|nr:MAG: valine--tRNA ligase [Candidatus Anoxymicrobium japonicum]